MIDDTSAGGTTIRSRRRGRSLPVWGGRYDRLRASPFIPFYEDRIGPDASFTVYSGHMSPGYLDEDVEAEYWHLRRQATLFDVPEHAIEFVGPDAARFLDHLMPRRIAPMKVGRCRYGFMCYPDGGVLMDGILVRLAEDRFRYVLADGEIFSWLKAHQPDFDVEIIDTEDWVLQVQGPRSLDVLAALCDDGAPDPFPYFGAARVTMAGEPLLATRTGWTSEVGFELYVPDDADHGALWDHLTGVGGRHGLRFAAMACMNVRRIEAGILNNGTDMSPAMTPFAAGLGRFVDLDKEGIHRPRRPAGGRPAAAAGGPEDARKGRGGHGADARRPEGRTADRHGLFAIPGALRRLRALRGGRGLDRPAGRLRR